MKKLEGSRGDVERGRDFDSAAGEGVFVAEEGGYVRWFC